MASVCIGPADAMEATRQDCEPHQRIKRRRVAADQCTPDERTRCLTGLPEEIVEHIAGYVNTLGPQAIASQNGVPFWTRPRHLHSLCLVSKKLHRIANPLLYSIFVHDGHIDSLRAFLSTIVRNPRLAACVRTVLLEDDRNLGHLVKKYRTPEARADLIGCAHAVDIQGGAFEKSGWVAAISAGLDVHAELALLLTQTPNLEVLGLDISGGDVDVWTWFNKLVFQASSDPQDRRESLLGRLRHLMLRNVDPSAEHLIRLLLPPFVRLPGLRKLEMHNFRPDEPRWTWVNWEGTSHVECLDIEPFTLSNAFLDSFLRCFNSLKCLKYVWGVERERETPDVKVAHRALVLHKDTLESLTLETPVGSTGIPMVPRIGSLRHFGRLRHLRVSAVILFGCWPLDDTLRDTCPHVLADKDQSSCTEFFPRSLETLTVECLSMPGDDWEIRHLIDDIVQDHGKLLAALKTVELIVPVFMWIANPAVSQGPRSLHAPAYELGKAGIQLRVRIAYDEPRPGRLRVFFPDLDTLDDYPTSEKIGWLSTIFDGRGDIWATKI